MTTLQTVLSFLVCLVLLSIVVAIAFNRFDRWRKFRKIIAIVEQHKRAPISNISLASPLMPTPKPRRRKSNVVQLERAKMNPKEAA